jgi:predicted transposase YdaD
MVADLLRGFVHEDWVSQFDFGTLEKVSGSFVADDLREREDDLIWRARWGDEWLYVYLLLEFQSTVDPFMAVRIIRTKLDEADAETLLRWGERVLTAPTLADVFGE